MTRMSRAGRKEQIRRIVYQQWKRKEDSSIKCCDIAKRMGLKSSTNIKNMCRELANEDDNIMLGHDQGILALKWRVFNQEPLPERYININGQSCRVADWVFDGREYRNA